METPQAGGALHAYESSVAVGSSTLSLNNASSGGAINVAGPLAALAVNDTTFTSNSASSGGGAVASLNASRVRIAKSSFVSNTALEGGAAYAEYTGAVAFDGISATMNRRARFCPAWFSPVVRG